MSPTVHTDAARAGLRMLAAGIVQAEAQAMRMAVLAAEQSAQGTDLFHDKTGDTRGSIRGEAHGTRGFVEARGAARFLEDGTKAHVIEAHGTALRFVVNGVVLYRARVNHPGTAPRRFMLEARRAGEATLAEGAELFVNYAIARA